MIQWYPGHMHKAGKALKKILPQIDLVIEVLDARAPFSSTNPMLERFGKSKPCIKILNKSDLADGRRLCDWQARLEQDVRIKALTCSTQDQQVARLPALCRALVPLRHQRSGMIYALITGTPNVGKSTLINRLAGRNIAKTGNEAALTRAQQRIEISAELTLIDTPGVLWPNIENESSGYRLAATGAIRDTALDLQSVAWFLADFFLTDYPDQIRRRFALETLAATATELLEAIARKRGCIGSGGRVDFEKVSRLLIAEFRAGSLGVVCLETPEMMFQELACVEVIRAQKAEKKQRKQ